MANKNISLDSIFKDADAMFTAEKSDDGSDCITVWIPKKYKARYLELQRATDRKFGKKIQDLVVASIDLVEKKSDQAS